MSKEVKIVLENDNVNIEATEGMDSDELFKIYTAFTAHVICRYGTVDVCKVAQEEAVKLVEEVCSLDTDNTKN